MRALKASLAILLFTPAVATAADPTITVSPTQVDFGETLTVKGKYWPVFETCERTVRLSLRSDQNAFGIGHTKTTTAGRFSFSYKVKASKVGAGQWKLRALMRCESGKDGSRINLKSFRTIQIGDATAMTSGPFGEAVNGVCKPITKQIRKVADSRKSTGEILASIIELSTVQQQRLTELGANAPKSVRKLYAKFLASGKKLIGVYQRFQQINANPNQAAAERATRKSQRITKKARRQARRLGAPSCFQS